MLLSEIKRLEMPTHDIHQEFRLDPSRFELIGQGVGAGIGSGGVRGMNSKVFADKQHPDRAVKVVNIRDTSDTYYRFLRTIELHQDNPFFPRVYSLKIFKHPGESGQPIYTLVVVLERLIHLNKLDKNTVNQLLNQVGIYYDDLDYDSNDQKLNRRVFNRAATRSELRQSTLVPRFRDAMRLLEPLFKNFGSDMHTGNLMVRKTKSGNNYQLVLIDPISPDVNEEWLD